MRNLPFDGSFMGHVSCELIGRRKRYQLAVMKQGVIREWAPPIESGVRLKDLGEKLSNVSGVWVRMTGHRKKGYETNYITVGVGGHAD
ncbi:MAG TPA: hypothetical protein VJW76_13355, partial [Verrucomicrobiae bacterium]|nr:hypothetical protein [Verrucomicrobiae bacterium]